MNNSPFLHHGSIMASFYPCIHKIVRTSVHFLFISHLTKVKLSIPHYIKIDFLFIYQNHDIFTKHQTWMSLRPGWYLHAYTSAKHNFIISIMPTNRDPLSSMIFLWIAPVDIFRNVFYRYNRKELKPNMQWGNFKLALSAITSNKNLNSITLPNHQEGCG